MPRTILTDSPVRKSQRDTHTRIKEIPDPDQGSVFYNDLHPDAEKGLQLRAEKAGKRTWVYVWYTPERHVKKLGNWPTMKPAGARIAAREMANKLSSDPSYDPIPERWSKSKQERRKATEAERRAKADLTLGNLLLAYVKQLEAQGKYEARAVENSLRKHVEQAHPDKWNALADELTMPDFRDIIATLVKADKYREAQKVRAYLRAAYAAAIRAHSDAAAVPELRKFNIQANPARDVSPVKKPKGNGKDKPRKPLTLPELRCYWKRAAALPDPDGAILRLHLLTGGQRLRQLCRLTADDVGDDEITLHDPKGRRAEEREHVVPLLPEAREALEAIGAKPWLVSFDGGETPADAWHVSQRVKAVAEDMLKAKETAEVFTGKVIRSTVETRLTQAGISPHVLAHLLSHGLGTLQEKHYQFYDFGPEKLAALIALRELLTQPSGDVVPMKRRAKK
jgi:integrase